MRNRLLSGGVRPLTLRLAGPSLLAMLSTGLANLLDALFAARAGAALSGAGETVDLHGGADDDPESPLALRQLVADVQRLRVLRTRILKQAQQRAGVDPPPAVRLAVAYGHGAGKDRGGSVLLGRTIVRVLFAFEHDNPSFR